MSEYVITKSLQSDIDYIKKRTDTAKKAVFEIAWKLPEIAASNDFADSGYSNIVEFASENFGFSKSTTCNYMAIAKKYLTNNEVHDAKGKGVLTTTCVRTSEGKITDDYKIGQLNALGKVTADEFIELDAAGIIKPEMSADSIKKAVKDYYNPPSDPDPDPDPDPEPEPEPVAGYPDNKADEIRTLFVGIAQSVMDTADSWENYCDSGQSELVEKIVKNCIGMDFYPLYDHDDSGTINAVHLKNAANTDFDMSYPEFI